jgi:hypothetical protein
MVDDEWVNGGDTGRRRTASCYRVYRHDMPFAEGANVWVKFEWDKKFKLVSESLFVAPAFLQKRNWIRTSFLRY